jgi:RimJ/RimL family protein N-acetyltransferase
MTGEVLLREVIESDLPILFEHQRDPEANDMAAFAARDWNSFMARWIKVLADETVSKKTILFHGRVAGNIVSYVRPRAGTTGPWTPAARRSRSSF